MATPLWLELRCIDPTGHGDITRTGQIWSYAIPTWVTATPAIEDGLLYSFGVRTPEALTGSSQAERQMPLAVVYMVPPG